MWKVGIKFICDPDKLRLSLRTDFPETRIRSVYVYVRLLYRIVSKPDEECRDCG